MDIVTDKVAAASKVTIHPGVMAHIAPLAGLPSSSPEKPQIENREELGLGTAKRKRRMIVVDDDDDEAGMLDREESPGLPAKQPKVQPKAAVQRVKNTGEDGGSDDEDED